MSAALVFENVGRRFGGIEALAGVTLSIGEGEIVGLIGPNGAGKTTLVNVATGVHRPTRGTVRLHGERIDRLRPDRIARRGIARTFQVVQPFPRMSARDNVAAAALFGGGAGGVARSREIADTHLDFCGLTSEAGKPAGALTLAGRKRLELAKSLALDPKILFLDEVNAGLNPAELDGALDLIRRIAARGVTIVLIEHLMKVVTGVCRRIVVLREGRVIADGAPGDVVGDPGVVEAYLGRRYAEKLGGGAFS